MIKHFEQQFGKLISLVKSKNSKCKVLLSNMCPRGDVAVTEINDVIRDLCLIHKVTLINSNDDFYDKEKKLRSHFYKPWDSIHLSRSRTKRQLGSFEQHITIVENFEKCVYEPRSQLHQGPFDNVPSNRVSHYGNLNKQHYNKSLPVYTQQGSAVYQDNTRSDHISNSEPLSAVYNQDCTKSDYNLRGHYYQQPNEQTEIAAEPCMKCGLTNHVTLECFHQKQVQCHECKCYGHKDYMGLCWNI